MPTTTAQTKRPARRTSSRKTAETREVLNMRIRPEMRKLIDHAAAITGKNRTDFVLDAARNAAQSALLDQTLITLQPKAYAEFIALLEAPPRLNARLRKTMTLKPAWG